MANLVSIVIETFKGYFRKEISASEMGYRVQGEQVERLLRRFQGFSTVEITDLSGRLVTTPIRRGPDGGIDLIFRISAPTEHGANIAFGRVKKILLENDY